MTIPIEKQLFTVEEYYKMAEVGILKPSDRVELINGEIVKMSPIKSQHASIVDILSEILIVALHKKAIIRGQNPIRLGKYSEPEPDVVVAKYQAHKYRSQHPVSEDVLLLIEVADSSIAYDKGLKKTLYAEANIPEYWIVNIPDQQLEIYRHPDNMDYREKLIYKLEETAIASTIKFQLAVKDLF